MDRVLLGVGGHTLAVEGDSAAFFLKGHNGFSPFVVIGREAEWVVRYDTDVASSGEGKLLNEFVFSEIEARCCFLQCDDSYHFEMFDSSNGAALVTMRYRFGESVVETSACDNASALRFSLWFAVGMLSAASKLTFVHSSTIVHKGRAVLFLGESGTGKSTHTRLWINNIGGSRLLNDDSPLLAVENGIPFVYGSPWSGKTPCYVPRRFPLAAIVRLSQAPQNAMRRLSVPEAFAALQPSLPPALMQDERYADLLIDIISYTISAVPSFHLACLPDADAARLSCKTIFGSL